MDAGTNPQSRMRPDLLRLLAGAFFCVVSIWGTPSPTLAKPAPQTGGFDELPPAPPKAPTGPVPKKDPGPLSRPQEPPAAQTPGEKPAVRKKSTANPC